MYQVFDPFLAVSTWHTRHPSDETRFFLALQKAVRDPAFSPDTMGAYMRKKTGATAGGELDQSIDQYVTYARAVRTYLEATGVIPL
jgi:hypothetical protein